MEEDKYTEKEWIERIKEGLMLMNRNLWGKRYALTADDYRTLGKICCSLDEMKQKAPTKS